MSELILNLDLDELSKEVLVIFFEKIREISNKQDEIFIALSGGTSLNNFYKNLVLSAEDLEKKFWEKIIFCFADERLVPLDDEDSNYNQLKETFLRDLIDRKIISIDQVVSINPSSLNPQSDYSNKVKQIEIFLLGSGPDGHIASLFPNHRLLEDNSENYLIIEDSPKMPSRRITVSKNMIKNAKVSFIFFIGEAKRKSYENFRNDNLSFKDCPAKLALTSKNCFVVTDLI